MKKKIAALLILILFINIGLSGCLKPEININNLEIKIHKLVNEERQKYGLPALNYDTKLADIARAHSQDMAKYNYYSHINRKGQDPSDRAREVGYGSIGENICKDHLLEEGHSICFIPLNDWNDENELAKSIVDAWMNSPGHRQNILSYSYYSEGIGVAIASNDEVFVTQDFL